MAKNPYRILGVTANATPEQIRKAFRKLALLYHPDRNKSADAARKFADVMEAYEILRDPERRKNFDTVFRLAQEEKRAAESKRQEQAAQAPPQYTQPRVVTVQGRSAPKRDEVAKVALLFSRGRFAEAEALAQEILRENPKEALAYAVLADIAKSRGEYNHAINLFARAVQSDPGNITYQQRYEELVKRQSTYSLTKGSPNSAVTALGSAFFLVALASIYIAVSPERPAFTSIPIVSTWTIGLFLMLFVSGVAVGLGLGLGGIVNPLRDIASSSSGRLAPGLTISFLSLVNFWVATAVYFVAGFFQGSLNTSLSKLFAGCIAAILLLSMGATSSPNIAGMQALLWGGNLLYLGAMIGWMISDMIRGPMS